jgi:hypothetical protein
MTPYTLEPWKIVAPLQFLAPVIATDSNGAVAVLRCKEDGDIHTINNLEMAHANAARIVACVNALAGIPDPAEFIRIQRELLNACQLLLAKERTMKPDDLYFECRGMETALLIATATWRDRG